MHSNYHSHDPNRTAIHHSRGGYTKTRTYMEQLKAAMHTATAPADRAEIRDEMGCVAMSWHVRQMETYDAD
jgi:hypothetical protein